MTRAASIPQEAERITLGLASSTRGASSLAGDPPAPPQGGGARRRGAAGSDVTVHGVVAGVEHAPGEPPVERSAGGIQHPVVRAVPVDGRRRPPPEALRV